MTIITTHPTPLPNEVKTYAPQQVDQDARGHKTPLDVSPKHPAELKLPKDIVEARKSSGTQEAKEKSKPVQYVVFKGRGFEIVENGKVVKQVPGQSIHIPPEKDKGLNKSVDVDKTSKTAHPDSHKAIAAYAKALKTQDK